MKTKLRILTFIAILISTSSCITLHNGQFYNSTQLQTNNFRYISTNASGTSTVTYFLGLGGGYKDALLSDAKKNLLFAYPLKSNQALVNTTVNYKTTYYFGIFTTLSCTINADIVEFCNEFSQDTRRQTVNEEFIQNKTQDIELKSNNEVSTKEFTSQNTENNLHKDSSQIEKDISVKKFNMSEFKVKEYVKFLSKEIVDGQEKLVPILDGKIIEIDGDTLRISYNFKGYNKIISLPKNEVRHK